MSIKSNYALMHSTLLSGYENPIAYDPKHLLPVGYWVCLKCEHDYFGATEFTLHKGDIPLVNEDNSIQEVVKCIFSRAHPDTERRETNIKQGFQNKDFVFVMGPNLDPGMYRDAYPFPRKDILAIRDIAKQQFELGCCDRTALEQENTWIF